MAEMAERFGNERIPLPPRWGGYRVKPDTMELWQGARIVCTTAFVIHDRPTSLADRATRALN